MPDTALSLLHILFKPYDKLIGKFVIPILQMIKMEPSQDKAIQDKRQIYKVLNYVFYIGL